MVKPTLGACMYVFLRLILRKGPQRCSGRSITEDVSRGLYITFTRNIPEFVQ